MAASSKSNNGNGTASNGPALRFEHVERRESPPYLMDTRVLEMIDLYPLYIESVTGHKPEAGEVVEKCLERVLGADAGFKKFVAGRTGRAAPKGAKVTAGAPRAEQANAQRNAKNPEAEVANQRPA